MSETRELRAPAKLLAVLMALALALAMMPAAALGAITSTSTASLTVEELDEGDTVTIYQIITATYDEDSNSITYALASGLESLTYTYDGETKTLTVDGYLNADSDELAVIVDAIAAAILGGTVSVSTYATGTVAEDADSYTFSNVAMGQYLVLVTPGEESTVTKVYKNTTANVLPTVTTDEEGNESYTLSDVTVSVKSTEITPSKTVEDASGDDVESTGDYSVGETVTYTVVTAVPEYPSNATNTTFQIVDTLGSGLAYAADSVVVKVGSDEQVTLTENTDYTVTYDSTTNTLTITLTSDAISTYAGQTLTVTYDVTITEDATTVTDTTTNSVKVIVADPYSSTNGTYETDEDEVELQVYGIYFTKVDASNTSTLLAGAVFAIYRESGDATGYDENDEYIGTTDATDENGIGTFVGLGEGTYYLVETTAPTGYVLPSGSVATFTISSDTATSTYTDEDGTYYYYVSLGNVTNTEQGSLPVTGDMGTMLFIAIGLLLICGAGFGFALRSRRKQADE